MARRTLGSMRRPSPVMERSTLSSNRVGARSQALSPTDPRLAGKASNRPKAAASNVPVDEPASAMQQVLSGHNMQRGRFGVQIVEPRSIIAWAKSPGRAPGTSELPMRNQHRAWLDYMTRLAA